MVARRFAGLGPDDFADERRVQGRGHRDKYRSKFPPGVVGGFDDDFIANQLFQYAVAELRRLERSIDDELANGREQFGGRCERFVFADFQYFDD